MLIQLLIAWCLMGLTVAIHAAGVASALRRLRRPADSARGFWSCTWLFICVAGWIVLFHLLEISGWGFFYFWKGAMPDLPSALYFSAVTYTTTGYGDLVLPANWRLIGGVEALTGILMCGWSTGFFFAVVSRMTARSQPTSEPAVSNKPPPS
jgi:hypothetical protein